MGCVSALPRGRVWVESADVLTAQTGPAGSSFKRRHGVDEACGHRASHGTERSPRPRMVNSEARLLGSVRTQVRQARHGRMVSVGELVKLDQIDQDHSLKHSAVGLSHSISTTAVALCINRIMCRL